MAAAAMCGKQTARAWDDEIRDLALTAPQLPAAALLAVCGVLESVIAEGCLDRRQSHAAETLRAALARLGFQRAA